MQDKRAIQHIHLSAAAPGGERFAIVTLDDGQFAITRDAQLMPDQEWPADQLDACTAEFARLTALKR
jgi:hypothetical protein